MLRTAWLFLTAVFYTLLISPIVVGLGSIRSDAPIIDRMIRLWARALVRAAGIRLRGENLSVIDPSRRYIIISNHSSYLDIPCLIAAIEQPLRFMAKASLFNVPVFGWGIRAAGFIPIDRNDKSKAMKSFDLAAQRIRKGNTIVVFPEEGRSATREMRPFQRGAFLLALRSGLPIVPVTIDGIFDVLPVGQRAVRPGPVVVRAGQPIETAGMSIRSKEELMARTRAAIEELRMKN